MDGPGRIGLNSYVLTDGAPRRRKNKVRPGVDGELGSKARKTPRDVQFEVFLDGRWDIDGDPTDMSDPLAVIAAVQSHILYLRTAILDDDGDAEGCVPCEVTSAIPGTTHEGRCRSTTSRPIPASAHRSSRSTSSSSAVTSTS